jgi:hypothetical protein
MAPWTGIEYAIASMMLDFGLVDEGCAVIGNVHERYLRAGRFWNHVECGDHYYRAMSSWAVLLGATGFKLDAPRGRATFAPRLGADRCRAPWVSATGWGSFSQTAGRFTLECRSGEIAFQELRLNLNRAGLSAQSGRESLACTTREEEGYTVVRFAAPVVLREGESLTVA